jgi:hypothetical protein
MPIVNLAKVGENLLVLVILGFLGWAIWQKMQGKDFMGKFRARAKKIVGGDNDGESGEYF